MIAIKITPQGNPYLIGIESSGIAEELHLMQDHIGGYIETVRLKDGGIMLVDEDGIRKHKKENRVASALCGQKIVGTVLIVGEEEDYLTDVPPKYFALFAINMV